MNKIDRRTRAFYPKPSRGLRRRRRKRFEVLFTAALGMLATLAPASAQLPTGADVVAGQAVIQQAGNALNIQSATARAIVNWDSFNVGATNVANFNLPNANAAILNRVISANMPSNIAGALNSNGHVYLVNPSGIVVSQSGVVNTNGFTASTLDITNQNFMDGGALEFSGSSNASVVNHGSINTLSGGAHLIANEIVNSGTIQSSGGNITMSGGGTVTLKNGVTYVQPSLQTLASGISPTAGLIQNTGTIRATGAATVGGEVFLVNPNGNILHDGTIAAQVADHGNDPSRSGSLTRSTTGGRVQLEADNITLTENSVIDATGTHSGGDVLVGGDWQGSGDMVQATTVTMESGATIDASAIESGDGGKIVLWSDITNEDSFTRAFGSLIARAGSLFGDGGQIETSGANIDTDGISVDAGAANGSGGLWLIDPFNYLIDAVAASNIVSSLNTGTSVTVTTAASNTAFGSSGNSADNGDISVTSEIVTGAMSGDATLTLEAARHINISGGAGIDATRNGNTAKLNVTLLSDSDSSGDGINIITADGIKTNGGDLAFGDGSTANIGGTNVVVGGDLYISGATGQSLETAGGSITINGESIFANSSVSGVTFNSDGGNIAFNGVLNSGNQYTYVDGPDGQANSWDWSRTDARNGTSGGSAIGDSYLVTITSRLENAIAGIAADYRGAWIGAYRPNTSSYVWQWADGPEGGQHFFTQSSSGAAPNGGGSAQPGWYSNFGANEPNGALSSSGETRGQFFGNQGLWNDLPATNSFVGTQSSIYDVLGYVRETNLAPTAVTVNAGSGTVAFNGGVGGGKALASLNVTSSNTTLDGNALVTTGAQNFSSALTATSTIGLNIDGTTLTTGGALNFTAADNVTLGATLSASGNVSIEGGEIALSGNQTISSSANNITLTADDVTSGVLTLNTTGHLTYAPKANAWNSSAIGSQLDYIGTINSDTFTGSGDVDWLKINSYSTLGGLTLGKDGNTSSIYNYQSIDVNGPVNLIGNNITVGGTIDTASVTGGDILLRGSGDVLLLQNFSLVTNGGKVTLWSDSDANIAGGIQLRNNTSIDTRTATDRGAGTHTTGGGNVVIAGGLDDGGVASGIGEGTASDGTPDGYATNLTGVNAGVMLGNYVGAAQNANIDLFSGGGDIILNGGYSTSGNNQAVGIYQGVTIDGGQTGDITMHAETTSTGPFSVGFDIAAYRSDSVSAETSFRTVDGDIMFHGSARNGTSGNFGISFDTSTNNIGRIQATGTGSITLEGDATGTGAVGLRLSSLDILASSGDIQLLATNGTATFNTLSDRGVFLGSRTGTNVTSSTSDILLRANAMTIQDGLAFNTTGSLVIEPASASFSSAFNWANPLITTGSTLDSLTLGKSGNSAAIQIGGTTTTTGIQDYYGPTQLTSHTVLSTTNSNVTFHDTLNSSGGTQNLSVNAGTGATIFNGAVGGSSAPGTITITGNTYANANITTTGQQSYGALLTIGSGTPILSAGTLTTGDIAAGSNNFVLKADTFAIGGDVTGTGNATLNSQTVGANLGVGTATSTVNIDNSLLSKFQNGFASIAVGETSSGSLTVSGLATMTDDLTLRAGTAQDLFVSGDINWTSNNALTLAAGDDIWINADIAFPSASGSLNLFYGGTNGTTSPDAADNFYINIAGRKTIDFSAKTANLKIGNEAYTLIDSVADFVAMNGSDRYALITDLDLAGTTYSDAVYNAVFTGKFDGLGHVANGMVIRDSNGGNLGLFAQLNGSTVRHLGVTDFSIETNASVSGSSGHEYRVGGLAGNVGGAGTPVSTITTLDGVWSSGVLSTQSGSQQKFFFGGGLIGSQNGGRMNLSRSFSTANVSSQGSYTDNLSLGGLVGDIGINTHLTSHTITNNGVVAFDMNNIYTTGSVVLGNHGAYYGAGGLVGVIFSTNNSFADSYSWSNVVGSGSFGGISGYAASGSTFNRVYTTQNTFGNGGTYNNSYTGTTLPAATSSGTVLPSTWSSTTWAVGDKPTLNSLPIPPEQLYVRVGTGTTSIYGDAIGLTYQIVDFGGNVVNFGVGDYTNLSGVTGSGNFTLSAGTTTGTYSSVSYLSGLSLTGGDANVFTLNPFSTAGSHSITARTITVGLVDSSVTKVYDGNANAAAGYTPNFSFTNAVSGDTISLNIASMLFNDKDVLDANTFSFSGLSLASVSGSNGASTSDYILGNNSFNVTAAIAPKSLNVTGVTATNKVYDGTTSVVIDSGSASFAGLVSGDTVTLNGITAAFVNKNVGTSKTINFSAVLGGADASNYTGSFPSSLTADITARALTVSGITAANKVYDGNTSATVDGSVVNFGGLVSGDDLSINTLSGLFSDKNAANGKTVNLSATYAGADVGNYLITNQASTTANITPKSLTVSGITAANKVYDGTANATVDGSGVSFSGLVSGDVLTINTLSGLFSDKNVSNGKTVNLSTTYAGADVGNYAITDQSSASANITPKAIVVSGITAGNKVYDGTTSSTLDFAGLTFGGMVSGDNLTASGTTGVFGDKNVGSGKTVTLSGPSYGGTDVGNYTFTDQTSTIANITAKAITVSGITASHKVYDGTTAATVDGSGVNFGGLVSGDDLSINTLSGLFGDKHVANGKTVTLSTTYTGADVGNYSISNQASTTADITPKALSISGITASDKVYDGTTSASVDGSGVVFSGLLSGDDLSINTLSGLFSDKNVANGKTVTLSTSYAGADLGNYTIADQASATANIAPKAITVSGIAATNKVYDGTTSATLDLSGATFSGIVSGDDLNASGTTGVFSDKNVGNGKMITLGGTVYGGADVGNYTFADQASTTADITPRTATISGITAQNKVYDGNTVAGVDLSGVIFGGMVAGDDLTVLGTVGTFADKNVGTGKLVALTATTFGGADVGNYAFVGQTSTTANITRLNSVAWIGGSTGDWNDPANWAGGAVPDLANVANVIIPGGVTPTFGTSVAGPVELDSFTGGNLQLDGGTLNVDQGFIADTFTQNGGSLSAGTLQVIDLTQNGGGISVDDLFTVTNSFHQSLTGTIYAGGDVDITHTTGLLTVNNIVGNHVNLESTSDGVHINNVLANGNIGVTARGDVTQESTGTLTARGQTLVTTTGNVTFDGLNNDFVGPVSVDGRNVVLNDSMGGIILDDVKSTGTFDVSTVGGDILQTDSSVPDIGGETTLNADGSVDLQAKNNRFGPPINLTANDAAIAQSTGDIRFAGVTVAGDLDVTATDGSIVQTSAGKMAVSGNATLIAKSDIRLNNPTNDFRGSVIVNSETFEIKSIVPPSIVRTGAALADEIFGIVSQSARDSLIRPAEESQNDDIGTGPVNWINQFRTFVSGLFKRDRLEVVKQDLQVVDIDESDNDVFIRRK